MIIDDFHFQGELAIHDGIYVQSDSKKVPVLRTSGLRLVGGRIIASFEASPLRRAEITLDLVRRHSMNL